MPTGNIVLMSYDSTGPRDQTLTACKFVLLPEHFASMSLPPTSIAYKDYSRYQNSSMHAQSLWLPPRAKAGQCHPGTNSKVSQMLIHHGDY